jgi:hypothetical protein
VDVPEVTELDKSRRADHLLQDSDRGDGRGRRDQRRHRPTERPARSGKREPDEQEEQRLGDEANAVRPGEVVLEPAPDVDGVQREERREQEQQPKIARHSAPAAGGPNDDERRGRYCGERDQILERPDPGDGENLDRGEDGEDGDHRRDRDVRNRDEGRNCDDEERQRDEDREWEEIPEIRRRRGREERDRRADRDGTGVHAGEAEAESPGHRVLSGSSTRLPRAARP